MSYSVDVSSSANELLINSHMKVVKRNIRLW